MTAVQAVAARRGIRSIPLVAGTVALAWLVLATPEVAFAAGTAAPSPTSLTTTLSGAGQSGGAITVPEGTAVTDQATLTGANASTATGTVTYNVYEAPNCYVQVGLDPETITTPGTMPASQPEYYSAGGIGEYFWQAVYSGDINNAPSTTPCYGELEQVVPATSLTTNLSGGGQSGTAITVPPGTSVTDSATLTGTNAYMAMGTVTYNVYSDPSCTTLVDAGTAQAITTPGTIPASDPVTLSAGGTYYWQAAYGGDTENYPSSSPCSPTAGDEVETVTGTVTGCTMDSASGTAFSSGGQSIAVENTLSSNLLSTQHLVLRSLSGPAMYFSLTHVSAAQCHDNAAYPTGAGDLYNTLTIDGTGSYGTSYGATASGFTIHFEATDRGGGTGVGADAIDFQITNAMGRVVWQGSGTVTSGGEVETG